MFWLIALTAALPAAGRDYAVEVGAGRLAHDGFLQTPTGGGPGTTSLRRPTFAELGLARGSYRWLAGSVDFGRYALRVRYTDIADTESAVLASALTSQGRPFAVGESVLSRASFDGLSLSVTRSWAFGGDVTLDVGPWLGWTAFDFNVDGGQHRVDRSYTVHAVGLRGSIKKGLGEHWRIGATVTLAPAFDGAARHHALEAAASYRLGERLGVRLSTRFEDFGYDDAHKQTLPNDLAVTRRVVPALSLRLEF